jgi:hypothetical protein
MEQRSVSRGLPSRRIFLANTGVFAAGHFLVPSVLRAQASAAVKAGQPVSQAVAPTTPPSPGGMNDVRMGTPMPADGKSPYAYSGVSGPGWPVDLERVPLRIGRARLRG